MRRELYLLFRRKVEKSADWLQLVFTLFGPDVVCLLWVWPGELPTLISRDAAVNDQLTCMICCIGTQSWEIASG